jgi:hypothetical protein
VDEVRQTIVETLRDELTRYRVDFKEDNKPESTVLQEEENNCLYIEGKKSGAIFQSSVVVKEG